MGDPKKQRKKYTTPGHPWQRARIDEEKQLTKEYGFKNKTEIWRMVSFLRDATAQAKKLVTLNNPQADKEKELLLSRMKRYGLLPQEAALDAILSISLRDVLERRLQTLVYKKNYSNSMKQARQFITHEHVCIGNKIITSPSYLVPLAEEPQINFRANSSLGDAEHPERIASRTAHERAAKQKVLEDEREERESNKFKRKPQRRPPKRAPAGKPAAGGK